MSFRSDVEKDVDEVKKDIKEIRNQSFAIEILKDYKRQNKRLFIVLMTVISMWFLSICAFVYYINTTGYEEVIEIAESNDSGNACIGNNCNNGVINGESNKKN